MRFILRNSTLFSVTAFIVGGFFIPQSTSALSIATYISDQSSEVLSGDRLYFQVEVKYPENQDRIDLRVDIR